MREGQFSPARTLLVEDHPAYAEIIKTALERSGEFRVVATTETADDAIAALGRDQPDVALIDVRLPTNDEGIAVALAARALDSSMTIVILSGSDDPYHVRQALTIPVDGFLSKDIRTKDLVPAIHSARSGIKVFSTASLQVVLNEEPAVPCPLSEQQLLLLKLEAEGLPVDEISRQVLRGRSNVYRDFDAIQKQLGARNRNQALVIAARNKWI